METKEIYMLLYGLLVVVAAAVARGHLRAARRAGVPALVFVGLVYAMEAAEILLLWFAVSKLLSEPATFGLVVLARVVTVFRFGLGQGMLVGASYSRMPIATVTGVSSACRFIWSGYGRWTSTRLRRLFRPRR